MPTPSNGARYEMPSPTEILLVEDDADTCEMIVKVLSAEGYGVRTAANGWEGLLAIETPPALILLDIMLPGMDGLVFLRSLRNTHQFEHVPVIVVTALDVQDITEKVRPFGVKEVVSKGETLFPQLKAAIKRHLVPPPQSDGVGLAGPTATVQP